MFFLGLTQMFSGGFGCLMQSDDSADYSTDVMNCPEVVSFSFPWFSCRADLVFVLKGGVLKGKIQNLPNWDKKPLVLFFHVDFIHKLQMRETILCQRLPSCKAVGETWRQVKRNPSGSPLTLCFRRSSFFGSNRFCSSGLFVAPIPSRKTESLPKN